jgi:hypothetical protein
MTGTIVGTGGEEELDWCEHVLFFLSPFSAAATANYRE